MIIDIIVVLGILISLFRGYEIGFLRQACSTGSFFAGLFLGALLQPYTVKLVDDYTVRGIITIISTLGLALLFLTFGEYAGFRLKHKVQANRVNQLDTIFGSGLACVTLLFSVWLLSAVSINLPFSGLQQQVDESKIVATLNNILPNAPNIIADLGQLIDPNGFPAVFSGSEPHPATGAAVPPVAQLQQAVDADRKSVVKLVGQGCGGIVDGSGFVVQPGLVATNAHVVAGIKRPHVQDQNGTHQATVIWFDPNLDFAVLRVPDLAGKSLALSTNVAPKNTPVAALGYPGGGAFAAKAGAVLDQFTATGRNIYGKAGVSRPVYEIQSDIIPGNSGGPMVNADGRVIGVVFAESTTYQHVGYALTADSITTALKQITATTQAVSTGKCAEQ